MAPMALPTSGGTVAILAPYTSSLHGSNGRDGELCDGRHIEWSVGGWSRRVVHGGGKGGHLVHHCLLIGAELLDGHRNS